MNKGSKELIYLLFSGIGSTIVGCLIAWLLGRMRKQKSETAASRLSAKTIVQKPATIIIKRGFYAISAGRKYMIRIDSKCYQLGIGDYHTVHVPPGEHTINFSNKAIFSDNSVDYNENNTIPVILDSGDELLFDFTKAGINKLYIYRNGEKIV